MLQRNPSIPPPRCSHHRRSLPPGARHSGHVTTTASADVHRRLSFLSLLAKPLLNWEMGNLARNPDLEAFRTQFLKVMSTRPEKDRKCLEDDFVAAGVIESTREAFKQDSEGVMWDLKMYAQPWGFELEEVEFPGLVSAIADPGGHFFSLLCCSGVCLCI